MAGKPIATLGSMCTCVGSQDMIAQRNPTVLINGKAIACVGDLTANGGVIVSGFSNIIIGSKTPEPPTVIQPIKKTPFPKITFTNRVLGNAKKAIANQKALRNESEKTDGEPKIYNYQWRKVETVIRNRKVLKIVTLTADVLNILDGQTATIKVMNPSDNENEEEKIIELTRTVQYKKVTVEWVLEESQQENK